MTTGFFLAGRTKPQSKQVGLVPACGACGLHKTCQSPKMPVSGSGELGILVVGEAPGETEDEENTQFVGKTGKFLRQTVSRLGFDLDHDCWKTNALACRPPKNRKPTVTEIEACRPLVVQAIKELKPRTIILLGGAATESVIGHLWKAATGGVSTWAGFQVPCQRPNVWICPTYHPSHVVREDNETLTLWWERHLEAALNLVGRPWEQVPEWEKEVRVEMNPERAARIVRKIAGMETGAVAFDYETTTLKPDTPWSEVVSCAVTYGKEKPEVTVAFPWLPETRAAMQELIRSPIPKIAQNMKFEDRWSLKEYGHPVRNWVWDTLLAEHLIDNRQGICGLKFQAFAHLGFPQYNDHIEPYLAGEGARGKNQIRKLDPTELLKYNGLDALLEWHLALKQVQMLGHDLPWRTK
jgi:uracil-DNA glycosylase family 4